MKRFVLVVLIISLLLLPDFAVQADDEGTEVDLEVEVIEPPPEDSGVGRRPPSYFVETSLFGVVDSFKTDYKGEVQETIEATSEDGNLTIAIPEGTVALDEDGKRLKEFEVAVNESPPAPPKSASVIGLAYDFGPAGATFNPSITFTWTYDPESIPVGVSEDELVLAYYDEVSEEWVELECVVDTESNTIVAFVSHFTTFTIIGKVVVEVEPVAPEPEIPDIEEPEEPEELIEPEEPIEPVEPVEPIEPIEPVEPDEPIKPETPEIIVRKTRWGMIIVGIVAGVAIVVAGVVYWWRRKWRRAEVKGDG